MLGCYDPENEEYQVICKLGTGFSEADLERMTAELKPHVLPSGPKNRITATVNRLNRMSGSIPFVSGKSKRLISQYPQFTRLPGV